jgi:hypothetical protein
MDQPKDRSRRALASLVAGAGALLALRGGERGAARRKRKKKRCPKPDSCPERACCVCGPTSPTPGCRVAGPASSLTLRMVCDDACGGEGTFAVGLTSAPGVSAACALNTSGVLQGCTAVRCPL